jgi:hypothetical protein
MSITTGQQNGFRSRGYQGAVLTGQEARILHYQNTVDAYISGASLPAGFAVYPA